MTAPAPGALAEDSHFAPFAAGGVSAEPEVSLRGVVRARAALLGAGLAVLALAAATAGALAIVAGPFHTALGSLG